MANVISNGFKQYVADGTIDLQHDQIKAALFPTTFTPNKDTHDNWGDVSASEISGTGYNAGGEILSAKSVTHDDAGDKGVFDAADVLFAAVTLTNARWVCLYQYRKWYTGDPDAEPPIPGGLHDLLDADKKIIGWWDLGADQSPAGVDFTVKWNALGILSVTQGA